MPLYTAILLLITAAVEVVLVFISTSEPGPFGGATLFAANVVVVLLGSLANGIVGTIARSRGEHSAVRLAVAGIGLWVLTVWCILTVRTGERTVCGVSVHLPKTAWAGRETASVSQVPFPSTDRLRRFPWKCLWPIPGGCAGW